VCGRESVAPVEIFHFEAPILKAGIMTRASRVYPIDVLQRAVEDMNETILFVFSSVDVQADRTAFSMKNVVGQISVAWIDHDGVVWVKGSLEAAAEPLKAVPYIQRKEFLEQFYLCPVSEGMVDGNECTVQQARFNGFVTSIGPVWEGAERLKITVTEIRKPPTHEG